MELAFKATSTIILEAEHGDNSPKLLRTEFKLDMSLNLDKSRYVDRENMPTKDGSEAITLAFIQGLVGNIHLAHQRGYKDSAEHLRMIVSELEKGFVDIVNIKSITG